MGDAVRYVKETPVSARLNATFRIVNRTNRIVPAAAHARHGREPPPQTTASLAREGRGGRRGKEAVGEEAGPPLEIVTHVK